MKHTILLPSLSFFSHRLGRIRRAGQILSLLLSFLLLSAQAQAKVVITVGASVLATYPSIGTAVAAVELLSVLGQPYEIQLLDASFTENVTFNKAYASPNTLTLLPAPGVTSVITGTLTFGTNSSNVIVSGHNGTAAGNLTLK